MSTTEIGVVLNMPLCPQEARTLAMQAPSVVALVLAAAEALAQQVRYPGDPQRANAVKAFFTNHSEEEVYLTVGAWLPR